MSDTSAATPEYHPDFDDPSADVIVKSEDGMSFRIHDFFLKAGSPVFRDMLSLSANLKDNLVPLPESREEVAVFLQLLSGKVGDFETFKSDYTQSLRLYAMARKYDLESSFLARAKNLLMRFVDSNNALECFAFACENTPADMWLAKQALSRLPTGQTPTFTNTNGLSYTFQERLCIDPIYAYRANPATWSPEYIARLGSDCVSAYLYAWNATYLQTYAMLCHRTREDLLRKLGEHFETKLNHYRGVSS